MRQGTIVKIVIMAVFSILGIINANATEGLYEKVNKFRTEKGLDTLTHSYMQSEWLKHTKGMDIYKLEKIIVKKDYTYAVYNVNGNIKYIVIKF